MNQTSKSAKDLKRGDMIRPHIDSAVLDVVGVTVFHDGMVNVAYRYRGEVETIQYRADSRICVIED